MRSALSQLSLTAFRNYSAVSLTLDPETPAIVLTGPNGAGKTNLLEAVSLLSPGRGLRNAKLPELQNQALPARPWAVFARLEGLLGPVGIGTGRDAASASDRRMIKIDGEPQRGQAVLGEHLAIVWLTPQMDGLFRDGASERRRYLDRLVFNLDPAHAGRVQRYERTLRERARLLRDGIHDDAWLKALEATLAETGVAIAAARRSLIQRLQAACAQAIGPFPRPALALDGWLEHRLGTESALQAEDAFTAALADSRPRDAEAGGAERGPQRADLVVRYAEKDMPAPLGSTGEQKALLIALTLANARMLAAERGAPPILLLDEVVAHLDADRRAALFEELGALGTQCWMTGTDADLFAPLGDRAARFVVAGGAIAEA